ncbi:hypothetical protein GCM10007079_35740 [Nocardiopsis terrae]|nr:hypothetical protein GCM10007079_35740 [Nocardiopsis terrae]
MLTKPQILRCSELQWPQVKGVLWRSGSILSCIPGWSHPAPTLISVHVAAVLGIIPSAEFESLGPVSGELD